VGLLRYLRGQDVLEDSSNGKPEDRALTRGSVPSSMLPYTRSALLDVNTTNALRVADGYACVRVLADSVASLPLKVYRRTSTGRVPAGGDSRAVQLLERPSPGSTSANLVSQTMVHLNTHGNAFWGKFRADGEIVQLGCLDPTQVRVELDGQRIVYTLSRREGVSEHGPEDVLHIRGMSADGLTGFHLSRSAASPCRSLATCRSTPSSISRTGPGPRGS
jgi:HK97 family phage portal protein